MKTIFRMKPKIHTVAIFVKNEFGEYQASYEEINENGLPEIQVRLTPEETVDVKLDYFYNEKKQLTEEIHFMGTEETHRVHLTYDENDKVLTEKTLYPDGAFTLKKLERDLKENSIRVLVEDEDGEKEGEEFRRFDSEGNVLEESIEDFENETKTGHQTTYDDFGNPLSRMVTNEEGSTLKETFEYERNEAGKLISVDILDEDDFPKREDEMEYDEKGNLLSHKVINRFEGWTRLFTYEYNENDKLILSKVFAGTESPISVVEYMYHPDYKDLLLEETSHSNNGIDTKTFRYEFYES